MYDVFLVNRATGHILDHDVIVMTLLWDWAWHTIALWGEERVMVHVWPLF